MAQVNAGRVRFVPRGSYDNNTQYYTFDLVNYEGNSYFAKENTLGNLPTDTNKWQLVASKGNQGDIGPTGNGISTIAKTSTSGLVDTYTITYTNGDTTTFDVTNGQDGNITDVKVDGTSVVDNSEANLLTTGYTTENKLITQKDYDRAMSIYNVLPKVNGTGENISLDNTGVAPLNMELLGNTYQETTTGANLQKYSPRTNTITGATYTCSDNGQITITGTATTSSSLGYNLSSSNPITLTAGTYTIKVIGTLSSTTSIVREGPYAITLDENQEGTFTLTNDTTTFYIGFSVGIGTHNDNFYVTLASGTTATTERYTNGASPNPSYPQTIQVVSGDNEVSVCGKNLYSGAIQISIGSSPFSPTGYRVLTTNTSYRGYALKVTPNETYSISRLSISSNRLVYGFTKEKPINYTPIYNYNNAGDVLKIENIEVPNGMNYLVLYLSNQSDTINDLQIELGSSATEYEEYKGTNYQINLGVKNLFDKTTATYDNTHYRDDNGTVTSSASTGYTTSYIAVKPNTTYTINGVLASSNTTMRIYYLDNSKNWISRTSGSSIVPRTFTTPENCYYIQFQYATSVYDADTIQLTEGDHIQYITDNPLELCNISDYKDYFYKNIPIATDYSSDRELGAWYLKKNIGEASINVTSSQFSTSTINGVANTKYVAYAPPNAQPQGSTRTTNFYSTRNSYIGDRTTFEGYPLYAIASLMVIVTTPDDTLENLKEKVNGATLKYQLANPQYIKITGVYDTLNTQLNAIEYAMSKKTQTNISQINNDKPFVINVETLRDISEWSE